MSTLTETSAGRDDRGAYLLINNKKLYFNDAEKTSKKNDDNICWAASASNMMAWTGWGYTATIKNEDDILDVFRKNFKYSAKFGGKDNAGIEWYLTGNYPLQNIQGADQLKNNKYQGLYKGLDLQKYLLNTNATQAGISVADKAYLSGMAVGMGIGFYNSFLPFNSTRVGGHAITIYGIGTDKTKNPTDPGYYTSVFIADPDNSREVSGGGRKAPDTLIYIPITWVSSVGKYRLDPGYLGDSSIYTYIDDFTILSRKPAQLAYKPDMQITSGTSGKTTASNEISVGTDNTVTHAQENKDVYLTFSVQNGGTGSAANGTVDIFINNEWFLSLSTDNLKPGEKQTFKKLKLGKLDAGNYNITIEANAGGFIDEITAFNNTENITINVLDKKTFDLAFSADEPADIFTVDEDGNQITPDDSQAWGIYFCIENQGLAKSAKAQVKISIDGNDYGSYGISALGGGKHGEFVFMNDDFQPLTAGNHLLQIEIISNDPAAESNTQNNILTQYIYVNPKNAPNEDSPDIIQEEEAQDEQSTIFMTGSNQVQINGAFHAEGDTDIYHFAVETTAPGEFHLCFAGAPGSAWITDASGTRQLEQGFNTVTVTPSEQTVTCEEDSMTYGAFTVTVQGDSGSYTLYAAAPGKELAGTTPDLKLSSSNLTLNPGESGTLELSLAWDPGREVTISLAQIFGDDDLSTDQSVITFNSDNWFKTQKVNFTASQDAWSDAYTYTLSADGLKTQEVYVTVTDTANYSAPVLTAMEQTGDALRLKWIANVYSLDSVEISRSTDGVTWETVTTLNAETKSYTISDFNDASRYYYRIAGINSYGVYSDWTDPALFGEFVPPEDAGKPVFYDNMMITSAGYSARIAWQQAGDADGITGYEFRYGTSQDLSTEKTIFLSGLGLNLNNLEAGTYYYQVRAVNISGQVSEWSTVDDFEIDYAAPSETSSALNGATRLKLNSSHSEAIAAGKSSEFFAVVLDAGSYALAGSFDSSKFSVVLYDAFGKKKLSANADKNGTLAGKEKLLSAGTYFIEVQSKNAKYEGGIYSLEVTGNTAPRGDLSNQIAGTASVIGLNETDHALSGGYAYDAFVGFSDPVDFYQLTMDKVGSLQVTVNEISSKVKLSLGKLDAKGNFKTVKTITAKNSGDTLSSGMLLNGNWYLKVSAASPGNMKSDTGYSLDIAGTALDGAANNTDDKRSGASFLNLGSTVSDWVGYGDAIDYFKFELTENSRIQLSLETVAGDQNRLKAGLFTEKNKKITLDETLSSGELAAGTYFVSVAITDKKKYQSAYELSIAAIA